MICEFLVEASIARSAGSGNFSVGDPGVPLRLTPGFMLTAAPRTLIVFNGCLSHLLDFIYDSACAWNYTVNHVVLMR